MTKARKNWEEGKKPRELEAQDSHCAVVAFLRREPFLLELLGWVKHKSHHTILERLLSSDEPVLAETLREGLKVDASSVFYATGRLNEFLKAFSEKTDPLKSLKILIQMAPRTPGDREFGYYFVCVDACGQRLTAEEIRERLGTSSLASKGHDGISRLEMSEPASQPQTRESGSPATEVSAPVGEVLQYLRDLANDCADLPCYFPKHLRDDGSGETAFDSIRQTVRVVEDPRVFEGWLAKERERLRRQGFDPDGLAYSPSSGMPEEEGGYGHRGRSMETIPWDERAGKRFRQAVILGDPGFGKTWLLRYEAFSLARKAVERLTSDPANIDGIDLPVLVRLPDLASFENAPLKDTLVALRGENYSEGFRDYLGRQLTSNHGVLLLDAWDEVSDFNRRRELGDRIHEFACRYPARILLTSRIVGYDRTPPPLPEGKGLELLAWDRRQVKSFVRVWFGSDEPKTRHFLNMLRHHPQFGGLARIP